MRILFSFVGGRGHLEPLLPVARAARAAGHAVAFAGASSSVEGLGALGFELLDVGSERSAKPRRLPLRPVDRAREERDLRERFVRRAARRRAPVTRALCESWRPDVLVRDETDFGAALAAEGLGLPCATVLVTATGSFVRPDVVGEALDALRAEQGLPPDPGLERLARDLVLSPFPPILRDPAHPLPPTAQAFRTPAPAEPARLPWSPARRDAPVVYFTLGTVFNVESGDLQRRVVEGLRALPVELVVTVGEGVEPEELGPQPPHVHVARHLPQAALLPHCDAVVSHGGSGSVLGALAHGLPSVLLPLGADQPWNAERCAALGAARVLDATEVTPGGLREALATVLEEPGYRRSAERLRDEIAALPGVDRAVARLGALEG